MNFSITELSTLTNKSRPTLYKYLDAYDLEDYEELPYSFVALFDLMKRPGVARQEIIDFCHSSFAKAEEDPRLAEVFAFLRQHKDEIDFAKLNEYLKKECQK